LKRFGNPRAASQAFHLLGMGRQIFQYCLNSALFGFQRVVDLPFNPGLSDFLTAEQEVIPFAGSKAVV